MFVSACFIARTLVNGQPPEYEGMSQNVNRKDIECCVLYTATMDPKVVSVPSFITNVVYKREFPRYFNTLTNYAIETMRDTPPNF